MFERIFTRLVSSKKDIGAIVVLTILTILSSIALFHKGFFRTIDDITVVRIQYLARELLRGEWLNNFPVRISGELSHGYGYPLYLFYGPLTYYAGSLIMIFGHISDIVATKFIYVFPLLIGPFIFYWAARQKMSVAPALAAASLFALYPFRGYDTYYRGGVGEAWAMAFLPGVFGGIFLFKKNPRLGGLIFALFLALCVLSHNISGLLILGFVVLYGLFFALKNKEFWLYFVLGLALCAFFWLPAATYLSLVKVTYSNQNTGQVIGFLFPLSGLLTPQYSLFADRINQAWLFYLIIVCTIFVVWKHRTKKLLFWAFTSLFFYFIMSQTALLFWKITLPITRLLQFPWRLFILLSFMEPLLLGLCIDVIKNKYIKTAIIAVMIVAPLFYLNYFKPKEYSYFYEYTAEDTGVCAATWGDEYIPVWVKECPDKPPAEVLSIEGAGTVKKTYDNFLHITALVNAKEPVTIIVQKYYFPGWQATVDNKVVPLEYHFSKHGLFRFKVPVGNHIVDIRYTKTPVMKVADSISVLAVIAFALILVLPLLKKRSVVSEKNLSKHAAKVQTKES